MNPLRPKKKWGQNFLIDKNIARKIVAAAEVQSAGFVIEIGPGQGALTDLLLDSGSHYLGIEIDPQLAEGLRQRYSMFPNFELIEEDFLKSDISALIKKYPENKPVIVGNIPYNITSPILFKLFDYADNLTATVLMMQKEVGERLTAQPASKEYGLLAINGQLFADIKYLFTVPANLFFPKPKVDSAVLKLTFKKGVKEQFPDFHLFRRVLRHCFQQRRKMLRKSLSMLFSSTLLPKLEFDLTRRPEHLSIPEWQELTASIHRHLQEERNT